MCAWFCYSCDKVLLISWGRAKIYAYVDGGIFASFELGGLGTDRHLFQFVKLMLSGRMGYELNEFSELFLEGNAGVLVPSSNVSAGKINPCDRFYLGGLGSQGLRGFHQYGVGHMEPRRRKVKVCA